MAGEFKDTSVIIQVESYATVPPGKTFLPTQCILVIVR